MIDMDEDGGRDGNIVVLWGCFMRWEVVFVCFLIHLLLYEVRIYLFINLIHLLMQYINSLKLPCSSFFFKMR